MLNSQSESTVDRPCAVSTAASAHPSRGISLAELLTSFSHRRPLDIGEASALCHQVLSTLSNHLLSRGDRPTTLGCTRIALKYPTVSTIQLTVNGLVELQLLPPNQTTTPLADWLSAFGQTLRSHTLVNNTQESGVFQRLTEQLCQPRGRKTVNCCLGEWSKTCLALCSRTTARQTQAMLQGLQQRATHVRRSRAYRLSLPRNQVRSLQDLSESDFQTRLHRLLASDNKDFKDWSNKWQTVNSEYLARSSLKQGLHDIPHEHSIRDSEETEYLSMTPTSLLTREEGDSDTVEIAHSVLQAPTMKYEHEASAHIRRTLKTFYSRFLAKPLSTISEGLKEKYVGHRSQL